MNKVIVAGSRGITDLAAVTAILDQQIAAHNLLPIHIFSGAARGVDRLAIQYAMTHNYQVTEFPANWDKYGSIAGAIRNSQMAQQADVLIAIWDGKSPGTRNMISTMGALGKPAWVVAWRENT